MQGRLAADFHVCRILELFFDEEANGMRVTLRKFRRAEDVYEDSLHHDAYEGLPCMWEEVGKDSRFTLGPEYLRSICSVLTRGQVDAQVHLQPPYSGAPKVVVGGGFCERRAVPRLEQRRRSRFRRKRGAWSKSGAPQEHLVDMRAEGYHMNKDNIPYASMPMVWYYDKYNATDMSNQVSELP